MDPITSRFQKYRNQKHQSDQLREKELQELRTLASERYHRIQELETQVEYLRDENTRLKRRT